MVEYCNLHHLQRRWASIMAICKGHIDVAASRARASKFGGVRDAPTAPQLRRLRILQCANASCMQRSALPGGSSEHGSGRTEL